jgi:nucleotide-binding universal stress UspA family protein
MPQIQVSRILLATDFSPGSLAALPYAVAFARHFHSTLYLAHVITDEASGSSGAEGEPTLNDLQAHADEQMSSLRAMCLVSKLAHEVLLEYGDDIWGVLSTMVEKHNVDLMVIGTQGRRGVEKLLFGSTAEEILRQAQKPVLMVGPESSVPPETELALHHILHPTDFSPESEVAMQYAYLLAKEYGASLALIHVAEDVWQEPLSTRLKPADFFLERLLERHWKVEDEGVKPEYFVKFGPRVDCILDAAARLRSELIVIGVRGARHPQIAAHLPGPTAYDIASRSRCPVLVIRGGARV